MDGSVTLELTINEQLIFLEALGFKIEDYKTRRAEAREKGDEHREAFYDRAIKRCRDLIEKLYRAQAERRHYRRQNEGTKDGAV